MVDQIILPTPRAKQRIPWVILLSVGKNRQPRLPQHRDSHQWVGSLTCEDKENEKF